MNNSIHPKLLSSIYGKVASILFAPLMPREENELLPSPYCDIEEAFSFGGQATPPQFVCFHNSKTSGEGFAVRFEEMAVYIANRNDGDILRQMEGNFDLRQFAKLIGEGANGPNHLFLHDHWIQDPFCILTLDAQYSAFLQPYYSKRLADQFVSMQLAERLDLNFFLRPTQYWLEGGNILVGDNYALVGKNLLARNCMDIVRSKGVANVKDQDIDRLEDEMKRTFGLDHLYWPGFETARPEMDGSNKNTFQPAFHLDLFMTLGGKSSEGKEIVFIGNPQMAWDVLETNRPALADERKKVIMDGFAEVTQYIQTVSERGDGGPQFEIIAIPLLFYQSIYYSYNNCIVEAYEGKKRAYIPSYITSAEQDDAKLNPVFEALEAIVEKIFTQSGFETVSWVRAGLHFRNYSKSKGSLNCISKVLRRAPYKP